MIELKVLNKKQAQIVSDINDLETIRTYFSIANPAHGRGGRFTPARIYSITPSGKYDIGLTDHIISFLEANQMEYVLNEDLNEKINIGFSDPAIKKYNLTYRDYQEKSIISALKKGRGVVVIPTAGGKTFIMSSIIESMRENLRKTNALAMVVVPSLQLVTQTAKDFQEYGMENVTTWSGNNKPDENATTIVAGSQILLSSKTDLSILNNVDILLIDEVHSLRKGNEINKIFNLINTDHCFGFTGTLPPSQIDQWNIFGKIGPIVYEEKTNELKEKKFISNFKITILNIKHQNVPKFNKNIVRPTDAYNNELEYLIHDSRRNILIAKLAQKLSHNTIIMVDRIDHGLNIEKELNIIHRKLGDDRPICFLRGSTEIAEREKIRQLMSMRNGVIVVAVSKIFSTGINIPNLHNIIFASAGKAKIKIMQSIGRALRLHPTKTIANIFDIADNTKYSKIHLNERLKLYNLEKYKYEQIEI
jgi:superfamily II DNA or RNA helicase